MHGDVPVKEICIGVGNNIKYAEGGNKKIGTWEGGRRKISN